MELSKSDMLFIILMIIIAILISHFFAVVRINGASMSPTYENGQLVIIKKEKVPQKGSLIIFEAPEWGGQSDKLIKRVIGLEGDEVYIDDEDLIINEVKEEHLKYNCIMNDTQRIFIKKDEYLVMGDNKQNSNDSIYRFCNKEEEFKVHKDNIYITGKEFLVIRRLFNE